MAIRSPQQRPPPLAVSSSLLLHDDVEAGGAAAAAAHQLLLLLLLLLPAVVRQRPARWQHTTCARSTYQYEHHPDSPSPPAAVQYTTVQFNQLTRACQTWHMAHHIMCQLHVHGPRTSTSTMHPDSPSPPPAVQYTTVRFNQLTRACQTWQATTPGVAARLWWPGSRWWARPKRRRARLSSVLRYCQAEVNGFLFFFFSFFFSSFLLQA
jgi:hypothetical protein